MRVFWLTFLGIFLAPPLTSWAQKIGGTASPAEAEQAINLASSASLASMLFKVVGGLIIVVGIMFFLVMWLKKMGLTKGALHQGKLIKLIDSKMIAPKKYVAVVQVGGDLIALGVSDQQITMLHHMDSHDKMIEPGAGDKKKMNAPFSGILSKATANIKDAVQG